MITRVGSTDPEGGGVSCIGSAPYLPNVLGDVGGVRGGLDIEGPVAAGIRGLDIKGRRQWQEIYGGRNRVGASGIGDNEGNIVLAANSVIIPGGCYRRCTQTISEIPFIGYGSF